MSGPHETQPDAVLMERLDPGSGGPMSADQLSHRDMAKEHARRAARAIIAAHNAIIDGANVAEDIIVAQHHRETAIAEAMLARAYATLALDPAS